MLPGIQREKALRWALESHANTEMVAAHPRGREEFASHLTAPDHNNATGRTSSVGLTMPSRIAARGRSPDRTPRSRRRRRPIYVRKSPLVDSAIGLEAVTMGGRVCLSSELPY
jgi:hypothetical protein